MAPLPSSTPPLPPRFERHKFGQSKANFTHTVSVTVQTPEGAMVSMFEATRGRSGAKRL